MIGPGKYDKQCSDVRRETGARSVILIVSGGEKGDGFSCQIAAEELPMLPEILRSVAAQIEKDREHLLATHHEKTGRN